MISPRVNKIADSMNQVGVPPDFGPDNSRLLLRVWKALARGRPITIEKVEKIVEDLGVPRVTAHQFLRRMSERDSDDSIIGIMGLSLDDRWGHKFLVNGKSLKTWSAWDSMFLPPLLEQTATIESRSPVTLDNLKLIVGPEGVVKAEPAGMAVTMVAFDPQDHDIGDLGVIWNDFCHRVHFFANRSEAAKWANGEDDVVILTAEEAYDLGMLMFSGLRDYA